MTFRVKKMPFFEKNLFFWKTRFWKKKNPFTVGFPWRSISHISLLYIYDVKKIGDPSHAGNPIFTIDAFALSFFLYLSRCFLLESPASGSSHFPPRSVPYFVINCRGMGLSEIEEKESAKTASVCRFCLVAVSSINSQFLKNKKELNGTHFFNRSFPLFSPTFFRHSCLLNGFLSKWKQKHIGWGKGGRSCKKYFGRRKKGIWKYNNKEGIITKKHRSYLAGKRHFTKTHPLSVSQNTSPYGKTHISKILKDFWNFERFHKEKRFHLENSFENKIWWMARQQIQRVSALQFLFF